MQGFSPGRRCRHGNSSAAVAHRKPHAVRRHFSASTNRFGARKPALAPRSPPRPEFRAGRATRRRVRPSRPLVGVRCQAAPAPGTLSGERIISGRPARIWPGAVAIKTRMTGRTCSRARPGLTSWPGRRSTSRPAGASEAQGTQGRNARWRRGERTLNFSPMARPSIRRQPTRLSSTEGRSNSSGPGRYVRDPRFCHDGSKDHRNHHSGTRRTPRSSAMSSGGSGPGKPRYTATFRPNLSGNPDSRTPWKAILPDHSS